MRLKYANVAFCVFCVLVSGVLVVRGGADRKMEGTNTNNPNLAGVADQLAQLKDIADVSMADRKQLLEDMAKAFPPAQSARNASLETYVKDVLTCLDWLSSCDFGNRAVQNALSQMMVLDCLELADKLSLGTERHFLQQLRPGLNAQGKKAIGADWSRMRNRQLEFQLHLWRRIHDSIDRNWNPKEKRPSFDPAPYFEGQTFFSGMSIDAIRDPKQRIRCKKAYEEYTERLQKYNTQYGLRKLRDKYLRDLEKRIERLYGLPPVTKEDLGMLKAYLRIYISDAKLRAELRNLAYTATAIELSKGEKEKE